MTFGVRRPSSQAATARRPRWEMQNNNIRDTATEHTNQPMHSHTTAYLQLKQPCKSLVFYFHLHYILTGRI